MSAINVIFSTDVSLTDYHNLVGGCEASPCLDRKSGALSLPAPNPDPMLRYSLCPQREGCHWDRTDWWVDKSSCIFGLSLTCIGSGKTGAFLIPILSQLMGKAKKLAAARPNVTDPSFDLKTQGVRAEPLVLIVCPTRELATQIFDEARRLCYRSMLRPCVVYGGAPTRYQRDELRKGCDILIGTTGRITDFMSQPNVLSLRRVRQVSPRTHLLHLVNANCSKATL